MSSTYKKRKANPQKGKKTFCSLGYLPYENKSFVFIPCDVVYLTKEHDKMLKSNFKRIENIKDCGVKFLQYRSNDDVNVERHLYRQAAVYSKGITCRLFF